MKRIIVVDDDPSMQDIFSFIFDADEYVVDIFSRGTPILNMEFTLPNIFILDKQLSGIDGLDICRFLKKHEATSNIPVIMMSASKNIKALAIEAGADYAFEKPFKTKELRETVSALLAK